MVYANFSSNLPTGLQHFEFVDLTIGFHCLFYSDWVFIFAEDIAV